MSPPLDIGTQRLLRDLAPRVLRSLVRRYGDFSSSEDAVQEAMLAATMQWPRDGTPDNPRGWLIHVASRRLADRIRSEAARANRERLVVSLVPPEEQIALAPDVDGAGDRDDTLDLLFMCCHSALTPGSAIALTLRAIGGLSTAEIARAFFVPEATMAQRISRAKATIKSSGARFEPLDSRERTERLALVMQVLYLIFNEGYTASSGSRLHRTDLSVEAIRLARMLRELVPEDCEAAGLLSLMLLTDARRAARTGPNGELVPLDEQDRGRWDREAIGEGVAILTAALQRGQVGPYQVQAAIAALHDEAPTTEETDWPQILGLYGLLMQMSPNPMIALNHAIALAMVHGPAAGLARLDAISGDPRIESHHRLDAARAHLLERRGDRAAAILHYRRAAERTTSTTERNYLLLRASRLAEEGAPR